MSSGPKIPISFTEPESAPPDIHITVRKLEALGTLSAEEREAFLGLIEKPYHVRAGTDIVADGSLPNASTCMIDGFACRYKILSGGRRQILSLQFGGDITDINSYVLKKMDHAVGALTDCIVASMPHEKIRKVTERYPNLTYLMWRDTLVEASIFRAWLTGVARKSAISRVAHFFCEQFMRMEAVGLTNGNQATLGVRQNDIADSLGLSIVHTNRVLQQLRKMGLIELRSRTLTVVDWKELQGIGEFDPDYLHFVRK